MKNTAAVASGRRCVKKAFQPRFEAPTKAKPSLPEKAQKERPFTSPFNPIQATKGEIPMPGLTAFPGSGEVKLLYWCKAGWWLQPRAWCALKVHMGSSRGTAPETLGFLAF
ncbi:hypothetical protein ES332_D12G191500v1 [Gossypium tomentosum]|uniref:Uncharacterized protein n=1 Tax=Gossypium tomentosum TaxID=34277 RepID=A0A5D2IAK9_GOSTO|nr:hypothetical protein ES332_D12G191500v1 [Gossypium tomentosum]